ncbi:MAG: FAD-dependent monooxygenase, partial [Gemmatimonadota bacterium]
MADGDEILIVGGGIAGLTAALALGEAGFPARVFERTAALREVGAGVSLWPNAMRALRELGLDRRVRQGHVGLDRIVIRRLDGRVLLRLGNAGRHSDPAICVHRAHLQRLLASHLPPDRLHLGREVVDVAIGDRTAAVIFDNGTSVAGRLVLGCDGIHSVVRARLHGRARPRYRGYEIWRGVSEFELSDQLRPQSTEWWAPGLRFGLLPGEPGRVYW